MSNPEKHHDDQVDVEVDDGFEGDEDAAAMAAAMGFSSFGMQASNRPSKKRRFDDAASGTGANSLPLHPRESTKVQKMNTDEIDLEGDDDDGAHAHDANPAQDAAHTSPPLPHGLPPKPPMTALGFESDSIPAPPGAHGPSFQVGGGRGRGGRGGGNGPNREWYLDYYDPSFNENPWERLEQSMGLSPVGSWLPSRSAGGKSAAKSS
ncbi:hypothetical protein V8F20_008445 [Naviculisporaceae sp. PSN 640]